MRTIASSGNSSLFSGTLASVLPTQNQFPFCPKFYGRRGLLLLLLLSPLAPKQAASARTKQGSWRRGRWTFGGGGGFYVSLPTVVSQSASVVGSVRRAIESVRGGKPSEEEEEGDFSCCLSCCCPGRQKKKRVVSACFIRGGWWERQQLLFKPPIRSQCPSEEEEEWDKK